MPTYDAVEMRGNLDDVEVWANEGGFAPGDRVVVRGWVGTVAERPRSVVTGGRVGVWVTFAGGGSVTAPVAKVRHADGGAR